MVENTGTIPLPVHAYYRSLQISDVSYFRDYIRSLVSSWGYGHRPSTLTVLRHLVSLVRSQTTSQGQSVQLRRYTVIVIMLLVWVLQTVLCVCFVSGLM